MNTYSRTLSNTNTTRNSTSKILPHQTWILIDSANVVGTFYNKVPAVAPVNILQSLKEGLLNLGYNVNFYMENRSYGFAWHHSGATVEAFEAFCEEGFTWIPGRRAEADEALLQTAVVTEASVILTNDQFRNYRSDFGEVIDKGRVLPFEIVLDHLTNQVLIQIPHIRASILVKGVTADMLSCTERAEEEVLLSPELACIEPRVKSVVTHRATQRYMSIYALRMRADSHDPSAFETLSVRYAMGEGVHRDYDRSATLDTRAIEVKKRVWQTSRRAKRQRANRPFLQVA